LISRFALYSKFSLTKYQTFGKISKELIEALGLIFAWIGYLDSKEEIVQIINLYFVLFFKKFIQFNPTSSKFYDFFNV